MPTDFLATFSSNAYFAMLPLRLIVAAALLIIALRTSMRSFRSPLFLIAALLTCLTFIVFPIGLRVPVWYYGNYAFIENANYIGHSARLVDGAVLGIATLLVAILATSKQALATEEREESTADA